MLLSFLRFKKYIPASSPKLVSWSLVLFWGLACGWEMVVAEVPQGSGQLSGRIARPGHGCGDYLDWSDTGHHPCLVQTQAAAHWGRVAVPATLLQLVPSRLPWLALTFPCWSGSLRAAFPQWLEGCPLFRQNYILDALRQVDGCCIFLSFVLGSLPLCFLTWGYVLQLVFALLLSISNAFKVVTRRGKAVVS